MDRVDISLSELQRENLDEYRKWCLSGDKPLTESTLADYVNAVDRYGQSIYSPADIVDYYSANEIPLPEKVQKGSARLFRYLKGRQKPTERHLNQYPYDDYITAYNEAKSAAGSRSDGIAHNVTLSEMKKWISEIPPEYGTFFLMLGYSGARIEQLYDILKACPRGEREKRAETIIPDEENGLRQPVFRMNVSDFGADRKKIGYLYFPVEFRETALSYTPEFSLDLLKKRIVPDSLNEGRGNRITGKTLRKWLTNLFIGSGVPAEVAGWIEGRVPTKHNSAAAVTWNNYADLDALAAAAYANMQDEILRWLPVDTFGRSEVAKQEPKITGHENLIAGKNKKEIDYTELDRRLRAGESHAKIIKELPGANKTKIAAYVKEHPELRRK